MSELLEVLCKTKNYRAPWLRSIYLDSADAVKLHQDLIEANYLKTSLMNFLLAGHIIINVSGTAVKVRWSAEMFQEIV